MIRTFVDASVLIAGARGIGNEAVTAEAILQDSNRLFLTSEFVRLEVLPKPLYFKNADEIAYYQAYSRLSRSGLRQPQYWYSMPSNLPACTGLAR